jgi:hypothetical protein
MAKNTVTETAIRIERVEPAEITFHILGTSPVVCNRMSNKGVRELLFPKGRKTAADKASSVKHDPITEYRESPYTAINNDNPTRIQLLPSMFKKAMMSAALDLPGVKKAQIGRLLYVKGERIDLYGTPQLLCSVIRVPDINRTPDVRTRAIVPRWACRITVSFMPSVIRQQSVVNLLAAAGQSAGVGDWRPEKGSGSYGTFEIVGSDHPDLQDIFQQGREVQDAALISPRYYDDETQTLLEWFFEEAETRGVKVTVGGNPNQWDDIIGSE